MQRERKQMQGPRLSGIECSENPGNAVLAEGIGLTAPQSMP